jgi:hypothetical protein
MDLDNLRHYRGVSPYRLFLKYVLDTANCFHEVAKRFEAKESLQFRASLVSLYRRRKKAQKARCRNLLKNHPNQGKVVIASGYLGALGSGAMAFYIQSLTPSADILTRLPVSMQVRAHFVILGISLVYMYAGVTMWRTANEMCDILRTIK